MRAGLLFTIPAMEHISATTAANNNAELFIFLTSFPAPAALGRAVTTDFILLVSLICDIIILKGRVLMKSNNIGNLNLSSSDVSAILCAIPLILQIETGIPAQNLINSASCESASRKLHKHAPSFSADEIRIISCAIDAALCVISGDETADMFDVDADWMRDLSRHFFTLNRLNPIYKGLVDEIQRKLR